MRKKKRKMRISKKWMKIKERVMSFSALTVSMKKFAKFARLLNSAAIMIIAARDVYELYKIIKKEDIPGMEEFDFNDMEVDGDELGNVPDGDIGVDEDGDLVTGDDDLED